MLSKRAKPYDPESLPPRTRLRRNVASLLSANDLSAKRVHELAADIHRVAPDEFADLNQRPNFAEHGNAGRFMRGKFLKKSSWMPDYIADIRCWSPKKNKVVSEAVPMQLLHEIVAVLLKFGDEKHILATALMDPNTLGHLRHCEAEAGCKLLGLGMWGDGAPTQWDRSQSIDVIAVSLPGAHKTLRIPLLALVHTHVCAETWQDVFAIIKWSLCILATGVWPTCRHDGSEWRKSDSCRKTARKIVRCALVEVRQDWVFAASVFNFPTHNTGAGCCWRCTCTPNQVSI